MCQVHWKGQEREIQYILSDVQTIVSQKEINTIKILSRYQFHAQIENKKKRKKGKKCKRVDLNESIKSNSIFLALSRLSPCQTAFYIRLFQLH